MPSVEGMHILKKTMDFVDWDYIQCVHSATILKSTWLWFAVDDNVIVLSFIVLVQLLIILCASTSRKKSRVQEKSFIPNKKFI